MIEFEKLLDGEPVLIAVEHIARVHGRRGPNGKLFAEVYVTGVKKPIAVIERFDQVAAAIEAAGVKLIGSTAGDRAEARASAGVENIRAAESAATGKGNHARRN